MTDWNSREGAVKGQDLRREQAEHQAEVGLRRFESGQRAVDRESDDDSQVLVLGARGEVAEEERRRLIKRTQAGVERAQAQGKWLGNVPKGFARDDDGYLQTILDPDRESGEISYLEVRSALTRVDAGESYRSVAKDVPNLSRTSLARIHKNEERRRWYLDVEADDERVNDALRTIEPIDDTLTR